MKRILFFTMCLALLCACTDEPLVQTIPVTGVTLDQDDVRVFLDHELTLAATVSPAAATNKNLIWESSDKSVVTVSDGVVKAVGLGTATVTVKTEDGGFSADCEIKVTEECQTQSKGPITLDLGDVTATTVCFNASLDINLMSEYQEAGFVYSTENSLDVESETTTKVKVTREDYSEKLTGLSYNTEYYYTIYVLKNGVYQYGEIQKFKTDISIELNVESKTQTAVEFRGKVDPSTAVDEVEIAVLINTSENVSDSEYSKKYVLTTEDIKADGSFKVSMTGLEFNTTHYYTYYILNSGLYSYGQISNFKTDDVPVTIKVENINLNAVTFTGNVLFSEPGAIGIGVQYYPTSAQSSKNANDITQISEDGDFEMEISGLQWDTEYCWQYYLSQNGVKVFGEVQTFKITHIYNVQSDLNISSATDLSSSEPANCYIVSQAGLYKFKTVKGNSSTSVGNVASASILWESFGTSVSPEFCDLISGFCYKDGYIAFQTADTFKEGNAVIAAKDASSKILWSWHIWLTDQPQSHVYNNNAGTMMDRNLGATSATPGDVGALGLLYQWGRKDPFLGSSSISSTTFGSTTLAKSTITWPSAVESSSATGTVDYVISNPTTFVKSSFFDWHYVPRDDTIWTTSDNTKSIYDPCPAGWRVPDGGENGIWSKAGFDDTTYDGTNEGISFSISSPSTTWYPASGYRYYYDGSLSGVGSGGNYWSASRPRGYSNFAYHLDFDIYGRVYPANFDPLADGYSVRCLQE